MNTRNLWKNLRYLCFVCMLAFLLAGAACAEGDALNIMCADGGQVFILEQGVLWRADADMEPQEILCGLEQPLCGFSAWNGSFYISYVQDGRTRFARLNAEYGEEPLFAVESDHSMNKMVVMDDMIYVLWNYDAAELLANGRALSHILRAYAFDGTAVELPVQEATDVAVSSQYGLIYGLETQGLGDALCAMNPATGERRTFSVAEDIVNLAWNAAESCIYFRNDVGIYRYAEEAERPTLVENRSEAAYDTGLICANGKLVSYRLHGDMERTVWPVAQGEDEGQLVLVNGYNLQDERMQAAVQAFEADYPGVEVAFLELSAEQAKTAVMAGTADLICLTGSEVTDYVDSGAVCDLNAEPALCAEVEHWVADSAFHWNGIRYGVAGELLANCLMENESLSEFAPQVSWTDGTWMDLLKLAAEFQTDVDGDGVQDIWFLCDDYRHPLWFDQYLASFDDLKDMNFDTDAFRALAEQYRACIRRGVIWDRGAEDVVPVLYSAGFLSGLDGMAFRPLPALENSAYIVPTQTFSLAVCRKAPHSDWAIAFLKHYVSDDAQKQMCRLGWEQDSRMYPAYSGLDESERTILEAQKAYLGYARARWYNRDFVISSGDLFEKYFADEITLDGLVDGLQQKLRMVLWG